jgi:hypothetical protein
MLYLDFICFGIDFSARVFTYDGAMDKQKVMDFELAIDMILWILFGHLLLVLGVG